MTGISKAVQEDEAVQSISYNVPLPMRVGWTDAEVSRFAEGTTTAETVVMVAGLVN
jgi:hypothetical protein